jgi:hypothetical protein
MVAMGAALIQPPAPPVPETYRRRAQTAHPIGLDAAAQEFELPPAGGSGVSQRAGLRGSARPCTCDISYPIRFCF